MLENIFILGNKWFVYIRNQRKRGTLKFRVNVLDFLVEASIYVKAENEKIKIYCCISSSDLQVCGNVAVSVLC